jgi:hypothetical protein
LPLGSVKSKKAKFFFAVMVKNMTVKICFSRRVCENSLNMKKAHNLHKYWMMSLRFLRELRIFCLFIALFRNAVKANEFLPLIYTHNRRPPHERRPLFFFKALFELPL